MVYMIKDEIDERLRRLAAAQPQECLPSERDLAAWLGCARTTVRRALARLQVTGTLRRSGPARVAQAAVEHRPLLVIMDEVDTEFADRILAGAMTHGRQAGRHLLLAHLDGLHPGLLALPPAGVMRLNEQPHSGSDRLMAAAAALGLPCVELGDRLGSTADAVASDHAAGAALLVDALVERGCRRILQIGHSGLALRGWLEHRRQGYEEALRRHGLSPLAPALTTPLAAATSENSLAHGVAEMRAVLQQAWINGPCDAVMALNDHDAAIVARALAELGHGSVQVTGYDARWPRVPGIERCLPPPAFTIDPGLQQIGCALTETLLARLHGQLPAERHCRFISPRLVALS